MKKVYLLVSGLFFSSAVMAQEVKNVGIGTVSPDKSAVLDISSEDKGLLIPRLNSKQINAISTPAKGLLVFQTDNNNSGFFFFNGEKWSPLTNGDANAIATGNADGWALDGNATAVSGIKSAATAASFIGTPTGVPLVFKVGNNQVAKFASTNNLFLGRGAGASDGSGDNNLGIGANALNAYTSGIRNVGLGSNSLLSLTSGSNNMGIGSTALRDLTTGGGNIAIGALALRGLVNGELNVAIGGNAMLENISGSNNIAIGTNAGFKSVGDYNVFIGRGAGYNETGSNKLYIANSNTANPLIKGEFDNKNLKLNTGNTTTNAVGFLAIGNFDAAFPMPTTNSYKLIVQGGIITEKVKVALRGTTDWADYVFEPEYKANMLSLEEVEAFTLKNKHLPNVPSAKEMVEKGLDVGETSKMFMEKIEELTLYVIELNKEVKALKAENAKLKK